MSQHQLNLFSFCPNGLSCLIHLGCFRANQPIQEFVDRELIVPLFQDEFHLNRSISIQKQSIHDAIEDGGLFLQTHSYSSSHRFPFLDPIGQRTSRCWGVDAIQVGLFRQFGPHNCIGFFLFVVFASGRTSARERPRHVSTTGHSLHAGRRGLQTSAPNSIIA